VKRSGSGVEGQDQGVLGVGEKRPHTLETWEGAPREWDKKKARQIKTGQAGMEVKISSRPDGKPLRGHDTTLNLLGRARQGTGDRDWNANRIGTSFQGGRGGNRRADGTIDGDQAG